MPETAKGRKIHKAMREEYGAAKGDRVFYASERSGKITAVARKQAPTRHRKTRGR
jgi:hypothetical protein